MTIAPLQNLPKMTDPLRFRELRELREDFPILGQTLHRGKPLIYLDNAASSQRPRAVIQAMSDCYERSYANVHRGTHWLSEESSRLYEEARVKVQRFVGADLPEEILFCSGTTQAVNTIAHAWGDLNFCTGDEILLTLMEHHSNIVPWQQLAARTGARVVFAGITKSGELDMEDFNRKLNSRTKLVGLVAVSNTLGTINPVRQIAELAHRAGAILAVDAAQHVPHAAANVTEWDADFVSFSGHKMLGPSGIGVLYGRKSLLESMPPFLGGGGMIATVSTEGFEAGPLPARFEAGTPPIVEAIGLGAAIDYLSAHVDLDDVLRHEQNLANRARERMAEIPGIRLTGPGGDRACGIVSFAVEGCAAQDIAVLLDLQGIAIRAGHHCTMPLHQHLGLSASCRASFYLYNTAEEADLFVDRLSEVVERLR
jgi:cysteine desulfurase / selenocysteine lyase